jgi:hypothetical protein
MSKDAWEEAGVKIGESELATLALNKAVEGITPKLVQVGKVGVESVKALGGTVEDTTEKVGTLAQRIAESFQVYGDLAKRAIDIVAQAFDAQKTKAIKLIETERDASIKAAGDNASKKEQIEQQAADKINAINEEFAKKQKKLSIAMAIINVAQGITKAIGQGGVLGLITGVLVAAAGAAQIATIQAQGFAMGTNFAPGGLAMVGERGPELVNLPRGSKVTPNHKLGGLQMVQVYGNIAGSSIRISNDRSNQRSDRII